MKIAIVGMSESQHQAPFNDTNWEVWGMMQHAEYRPVFDRVFEMHPIDDEMVKSYIDKMDDLDAPVYMQEAYYDGAVKYPFEKVEKEYFSSTIGYMLALAISENPDEIAIYGVDMASKEEYLHQRANAEYFIGLAQGKGIKVTIPESSPLLKYQSIKDHGYTTRYGWAQ
jgi:hypothetical protein